MNDEQFFLANAYLDGELTAEERAIAEADPTVMAEVESLRALQSTLRDVDAPSAAARESAIAAAMTQFTSTAARPATDEVVVPIRRHLPYRRYLAVAAGVLGVGLLGVAVANLNTGDGDDSAADEPASEEPAAAPEARLTEDATAATAGGDATSEMAEEMMVADEPASEPAMDAAAEEPAAEEPAAEAPAFDEPASDASDDAGVTRPELIPGQVLTTPAELGSFGTGLIEQRDTGTLPPTPESACPIENVLGRTEYLVDGDVLTLLVAVDEPAGIVLGFDDDTCEYVVDGPLYLP